MEMSFKFYIDYLYSSELFYEDEKIKRTIKDKEEKFYESLSWEQKINFDEINKLKNKLRDLEYIHLIEFVMKKYEQ